MASSILYIINSIQDDSVNNPEKVYTQFKLCDGHLTFTENVFEQRYFCHNIENYIFILVLQCFSVFYFILTVGNTVSPTCCSLCSLLM